MEAYSQKILRTIRAGIAVPALVQKCGCGTCRCQLPGMCSCTAEKESGSGSGAGARNSVPAARQVRAATALAPGEAAAVVHIGGSERIARRLADLGLTAGTRIRLVRSAPLNGPVEIAVRGTRLAVDRHVAENICITGAGDPGS